MNELIKSTEVQNNNYPRVLLVNIQSIGSNNATGKTLQNLFSAWPNKNLMEINLDRYFDNNYKPLIKSFRLEPSWVPIESAFRKLCKLFTGHESSEIQANSGLNSAISDKSGLGKLHDFIRAYIDISHLFLPSNVISEIEAFKPDIIYTMGATIRSLKLSNYLSKMFNISVCLHLMDNWPDTKYTSSFMVYPARKIMLKELKKINNKSGACLAISPKMAEYYSKRYGISYFNAMNCIDYVTETLYRYNDNECVRFLYAGGLHLNRWKSLLMISKYIEKMKNKGFNVELIAYLPDADRKNFGELLCQNGVKLNKFVPSNEIEKVLSNADVLLLIESFDENVIPFTLYSMSTKVPEYMAAGRCILSFSPKILASSEYIEKTKSGVVAETESELEEALKVIIINKSERIRMARNGVKTAKENHTKKMVTETMLIALTAKSKEKV